MNEDVACPIHNDSVTPPYSPLAVMKLDFANIPAVNEDILLDKNLIDMAEETELE
jgi:hypothetical protein